MKFYYSNNGITVKLVRDIRNKNPENECPLRWRVTYKEIATTTLQEKY